MIMKPKPHLEQSLEQPRKRNKYVKPWISTGTRQQPAMQTRNTIFTITMPFAIILSQECCST